MTGEISIEIMLDSQDHPNNSLEQEVKKGPPFVDSPTATLSCISDYDSQEEDDKIFKQDNDGLAGNRRDSASRSSIMMPSCKTTTNRVISAPTVPPPTNTASTQYFDQPTMKRMRQDFDNWKRERHELLTLRKLVRKQEQRQEELQAQLKVQKERGQVPDEDSQRDQNDTIDQNLVTDIGDRIRQTSHKQQNSFPEDEITCQLEEMQSNLETSRQQVHDLQDQLLELRTEKERSKENQRRIREKLEYQLDEAREELDAERQAKGNIILRYEERLKAQQVKAEEHQNKWNSKIQFWKQQYEKSQQQLQEQPTADPKGHSTKLGQESSCKEDDKRDNGGTKGKVASISSKQPDEQMPQLSSIPEEEEVTISKLEKELSDSKTRYEESKVQLAKLEFVIQDMASNKTLLQKIASVIDLLQKTRRENEKLQKEKLTLITRSARR